MLERAWLVFAIAIATGCGDDDGTADVGRDAGSDSMVRCDRECVVGYTLAADCTCVPVTTTLPPPPQRGTWREIAHEGAPSPRTGHSIVWTGVDYVVWGGASHVQNDVGTPLGDGARYDPALDRWRPVSMDGAPPPRSGHRAAWTGEEMVVFGEDVGVFPAHAMEGWLYDPERDAWRAMSTVGAPTVRAIYAVVAIDGKVVVWGGYSAPGESGPSGPIEHPATSGGIYDPETDTWTAMSEQAAPRYDGGARSIAGGSALWTFGSPAHYLAPGAGSFVVARYDLAASAWTTIATIDGLAPSSQSFATSLWFDGRLLSISRSSDGQICELVTVAEGQMVARSDVASQTSPNCLGVTRHQPLLASEMLVAVEPMLLMSLRDRQLFAMPAIPYAQIVVGSVAGYGLLRWDGHESATDGTSVLVFGGSVEGMEQLPPCPDGAPCAAPGSISLGAIGAVFTP